MTEYSPKHFEVKVFRNTFSGGRSPSEALRMPKGGAMDRPSRNRWPKARTRRRGQEAMSLKDDKQQNTQIELDFSSALMGEDREAGREGAEPSGAMTGTENPARIPSLFEEC